MRTCADAGLFTSAARAVCRQCRIRDRGRAGRCRLLEGRAPYFSPFYYNARAGQKMNCKGDHGRRAARLRSMLAALPSVHVQRSSRDIDARSSLALAVTY